MQSSPDLIAFKDPTVCPVQNCLGMMMADPPDQVRNALLLEQYIF